jgi:ABC-type multidrug transport system ATPase subunit/ABC-type nitrate/sulfonate/bicarbonate transport system permease component
MDDPLVATQPKSARSGTGALPQVKVDELRAGYPSSGGFNPFEYDVVVDGVSFEVGPGEIVGIRGRNASGKSTLLSAIVDPGSRLGGEVLSKGEALRPGMIAYMPQSAGETLSPWLDVEEEIALPLRVRRVGREQWQSEVSKTMREHGIYVPRSRKVSQLSGGQRVKVALLRSFTVPNIRLFVLDEPFEGLDAESRQVMIGAIRDVADRGVPILMTSHRSEDLQALGARQLEMVESPVTHLVEVTDDADPLTIPERKSANHTDSFSEEEDVLSEISQQEEFSSSSFNVISLFGLVVGTGLWYLLAKAVSDPGLLPGPFSVFEEIIDLLSNPDLLPRFGATMTRALAGWVLANAAAIPLGVLLGYDTRIYRGVAPWLSLGRALPVFVLLGPAVGLFPGLPYLQRHFLIWLTLFLISLQAITVAAALATRGRIKIARIFGASHWFRLRHIMPYESLGGIFAALEVTLPLAVVVTFVVELFLIPQNGLGIYVFNHLTDNDLSMLFAHILLPGIIAAIGMRLLRSFAGEQKWS